MSQKPSSISRKLEKILQFPLDDKQFQSVLESVAEFYDENTLSARRNLRGRMESKILETHQSFLESMRPLYERVKAVQVTVDDLSLKSEQIGSKLHSARSSADKVLTQADHLQTQLKQTEKRERIAAAFLQRFQLSEEEVNALQLLSKTNDGLQRHSMTPEFFSALQRVHQIHSDCKLLLKAQHQRAGLEIMDSMDMYQEVAYDALYRWAQAECKKLAEESADVSPLLNRAIHALSKRPILLKYCIEEISNARRVGLIRKFFDALTKGGPQGYPRPIEMQAHDPYRYLSDILAWIHQALAGERDAICDVLVGVSDKSTASGISSNVLQRVLDGVFEGLSRHFRIRVDQVLVSQPDLIVVYRIGILFEFYFDILTNGAHSKSQQVPTLGKDSSFPTVLLECKRLAEDTFFDTVQKQMDRVMLNLPPVPPDLAPPQIVQDTVSKLSMILKAFDKSIVPNEQRKSAILPVLERLLYPILKLVDRMTLNLDSSDGAVFTINCLYTLQTPLSDFSFVSDQMEQLYERIESLFSSLVRDQAENMLRRCGFFEKMQVIENHSVERDGPLSDIPNMDPLSLQAAVHVFSQALANMASVVVPQCDRLLSPRMRMEAKTAIRQTIAKEYCRLYEAVMDARNAYDDPNTIVYHSPEQVRMLLDCD